MKSLFEPPLAEWKKVLIRKHLVDAPLSKLDAWRMERCAGKNCHHLRMQHNEVCFGAKRHHCNKFKEAKK